MLKGDGQHAATMGADLLGPNDLIHRPVPTLDQDVGHHGQDEVERGVLLETGDETHGLQRCHHSLSVL
jgi:hypothetical protein